MKLGFTENDQVFTKQFDNYELNANFKTEELIYPENTGFKINERQTCNFSSNENFVVFECVHRLFEKGYNPKHLELEPKWKLGHGASGGRADIWVKDNDNNSLLIIECKTAGNEFEKAWKDTLEDGGQLFSYFQQEKSTQFLALYASDFADNEIKCDYKLIPVRDDISVLANRKNTLSFEKAKSVKDLFKVWKEIYLFNSQTNGLFDDNISAYLNKKYTVDDLKEVDNDSIQKKYHEFATILRQHNVSGHENAFDKLVNLFLAKIVDETTNKGELAFYWKGAAYDDVKSLIDRLQKHYKIGMEKFLNEDVTYIEKSQIDDAFKFVKNKPDATKTKILEYFDQLKYYTNNDFAFIDVHNEKLFYQNAEVLLKMVQMLQDIKLQTETQNQFLGDLFEGFLDKGVKQSEGQFFTPMPIVKFLISSLPLEKLIKNQEIPKVIDYACGAGHFLNEYAHQILPFIKKTDIIDNTKIDIYELNNIKDYFAKIVGIEKEYRLSKVAKVSSFMYGQDNIEIIYADALAKNETIKDGTFSVLVANPPYSVKGFLETLDDDSLARFELFQSIDDKQKKTNNSIECFFVERAKQLLAPNGVAAIILPSSILSNGNIYIKMREILLKYFDIIAIAEFGSGTFGKTGTNTATLFLRRKDNNPDIADHFKNCVDAWFDKDSEYVSNYAIPPMEWFKNYCARIGVSFEDYETLLSDEPNENLLKTELFREYKKAFDSSTEYKNIQKKRITDKYKQEDKKEETEKAFLNYIRNIEKDKLYYYLLAESNPQPVCLVKSPNDNKAIKNFLGYEWSSAKGNEGIKYLNTSVADDDDFVSVNKGINSIQTPLFNPLDLSDPTKINSIIRANFMGEKLRENEFVSVAKLTDMLDFSRVSFDKALKTTPEKKIEIVSKYPVVKLGEIAEVIAGQSPEGKFYNENRKGLPFYQGKTEFSEKYILEPKVWTTKTTKEAEKNDILMSVRAPVGPVNLAIEKCCIGRGLAAIRVNEKINRMYLFLILKQNEENIKGSGGAIFDSISKSGIKNIKIPLPPLDIQKQIVAECEVIDNASTEAQTKIEELKNNIAQIMQNVTGEKRKIGELCALLKRGKSPKYGNSTVQVIKSGQARGYLNFDFSDKYFVDSDFILDERKLQKGDILINSTGVGTAGRVTMFDLDGDYVVDSHITIFRPNNKIISRFVLYSLANIGFNKIQDMATGASGQIELSLETIKQILIPVPPLSEQERIVTEIEKMEVQISEAQKIIDSAAEEKRKILDKYIN